MRETLRPANGFSLLIVALSSAASAGIAVSQRKVRQISDPIQQILIQLHKIIYITQVRFDYVVLVQAIVPVFIALSAQHSRFLAPN